MISGLHFSSQTALRQSVHTTCEQITGALCSFAHSANETPVESTHQVRKKLKFFRAFVKLLKFCAEPGASSAANRFLRDLGRQFSDLRDAHVRRFHLAENSLPGTDTSFKEFMAECTRKNNEIISRIENEIVFKNNHFQWFANEIQSNTIVSAYFADLNLSEENILHAYADSFSKSRLAFQSGFIFPDSELMHEWRKRMKDVQYQTELIAGQSAVHEIPYYETVVLLCDYLGEMNDLYMLGSWASGLQAELRYHHDLRAWLSEVTFMKNSLQRKAEELGNQLYQTSDKEIQGRLKSVTNG